VAWIVLVRHERLDGEGHAALSPCTRDWTYLGREGFEDRLKGFMIIRQRKSWETATVTNLNAHTRDGDLAVEPEIDGFSRILPLPYRVALIIVLGT
jgi:hypothetical protein